MDSTISSLSVAKVSMGSTISLKTINSTHPKPKNISTYSTFYNPQKRIRRQPISCSTQDNNPITKSVDSLINELSPTECPVVDGEVPFSLNGVYIRNGPNPQYMPRGPLHLFEGDGMVHSIQLSKGRAVYACRYVKTYKFKLEGEAGFPIFPNMLSGFYGLSDIFKCFIAVFRVLIGHINIMEGYGLANTSVAFFSGKLVALCEADLSCILQLKQEGDIETLG
ncbi:hypothetical protein JRO89_XS10G0213300 [Xanthoceras sorbifolium]|uniref:Carotenoid oxygenase n=1 Tax=Xanthoceras sorbifolium TaxID=99658 RepID=A0ABQ8HJT8_9ROSI|nr:hypothetical protein JRO89_XS10G0213300 [Xanthoceras sorbifolium]